MPCKRGLNGIVGVFCALMLYAAPHAPAGAAESKPLTFALVQSEETSRLGARWDSTLKYISK